MRAKVLVEFDVTSESPDEMDERMVQDAAEQAAYDYLALVAVSGYSTDTESVRVYVDGHGPCFVSLVED